MTIAPDIHTHTISQTINQHDVLVQPHASIKAVVSGKTIQNTTQQVSKTR